MMIPARLPVPEPDTSTNLEATCIGVPSIPFHKPEASSRRRPSSSARQPALLSACSERARSIEEMMLSGHGHGGGRRLFTASQWQELEHQALIFKYMASGAPVPHDLVLPLRLATGVDTAPSLAFPPHPSPTSLAYWGCYGGAGAGAPFGRKAEDPEPGRCRRTDGKKWRCSREAHGDSKYCEKHIHRGKTRSRKPVELTSSSSSATSPAAAAAAYRPSALSISPPRAADAPPPPQHLRHGVSSPAAARDPAQQATAGAALQLHLDASLHAASPPPSYHRYAHSQSHAYYTPPPPALFPGGGVGGYDYGQSKELREAAELRRRHFHALGADLSLDKPSLSAADTGSDAAAAEKPLRRFFDEWPRESGDARPLWAGADDATQLSISIPAAAAAPSDLAASAAGARYHNGE